MAPVPLAVLSFAHLHAGLWSQAFARSPLVELTAVWDDRPERGRKAASRFGVDYVEDLEELLRDGGVKAVAVCSETSQHARLVTAAAAYGKDVLCEKPMATNMTDCDRIRSACREAGVTYVQSFPQRIDPSNQKVKQLLDEGAIGRVLTARKRHGHGGLTLGLFEPEEMHWFLDPDAAGGGALLDEGVHGADLLRWLFGDPTDVMARTETRTAGLAVEDNGIAVFHFGDGVRATLEASWTHLASTVSLEIYGTDGVLIQQGNDSASSRVSGEVVPRLLLYHRDAPVQSWQLDFEGADFFASPHTGMADAFARILNGESMETATLDDGERAVAMIVAAYESAISGQLVTMDSGRAGQATA